MCYYPIPPPSTQGARKSRVGVRVFIEEGGTGIIVFTSFRLFSANLSSQIVKLIGCSRGDGTQSSKPKLFNVLFEVCTNQEALSNLTSHNLEYFQRCYFFNYEVHYEGTD